MPQAKAWPVALVLKSLISKSTKIFFFTEKLKTFVFSQVCVSLNVVMCESADVMPVVAKNIVGAPVAGEMLFSALLSMSGFTCKE